jgi:putative nucleotidyltransferase with HDIG domain
LDKNLEGLNSYYNKQGLIFCKQGENAEIIRIIEKQKYYLQDHNDIKEKLKWKYGAIFKPGILWHIPEKETTKLKSKELKLNPSDDEKVLKNRLNSYVEKIQETSLKNSMRNLLKEINYLSNIPCTKIYHHTYEYGLLEHTVQILDLSTNITEIIGKEYNIDSDLIISGCILHDVGKINCYRKIDGVFEYTDIQDEQGHIVNGIKLAAQYIKSEKLDKIIHIIASHHSEKKWGSPIPPAIPEAWIIHTMDNLSAKILG